MEFAKKYLKSAAGPLPGPIGLIFVIGDPKGPIIMQKLFGGDSVKIGPFFGPFSEFFAQILRFLSVGLRRNRS